MMKKIAALCCLLALALSVPGFVAADTLDDIQKRGVLRVGMEPGYMPFEMTNKKGEFIGFDMDYGRRLAKSMGVTTGSFYWHFKNRREFLDALLDYWEREMTDAAMEGEVHLQSVYDRRLDRAARECAHRL